ncbi:MAG: Protein GrpE [Candidatus Magasanikbacteria bacterium GW2011_GWA2_37_8]|uniref:Protein GrpE n=1 Tax=Candidatus Magasanikbacteria bacterium GW2011_GWA2_37_8 TaxID=1619036 RepID=A0A0G0HAH3_9BACT|nr:MAG: Protein GrpE [Candidatus Magasanikbacteria bacterium GW2011_GWA2_37_8]
MLEEFIPVYDHLRMAIQGVKNKEQGINDPWVDGVNHVLRQFAEILKSHGVEEIKTVGEIFNPELHEAVGEEEGEEEGKILREIFAGYTMNGKVIRPAKVIVTK